MSCRFAHDDAAYVLGALSPRRATGVREAPGRRATTAPVLSGSSPACPGLLGRVDAASSSSPQADEPVPDTLLPALSREVAAQAPADPRTAGLAAAVAAVWPSVPAVVSQLDGDGSRVGASRPSRRAEPRTARRP